MKNMAEALNEKIMMKRSATCVGLDPILEKIPECYKKEYRGYEDEFEAVGRILFDFNRDIIDCVADMVPVVKPQMAFYEQYGMYGIQAFEKTVGYAREKGLLVIEDGKRNDIGNTAAAYANAHLGKVKLLSKEDAAFDADWLTVSPFLGWDGVEPFAEVCAKYAKGIFVLVRTSNDSAGEIQDCRNEHGDTLTVQLAKAIREFTEKHYHGSGYAPIGAVVGATYPKEAHVLREIMPRSVFLVPGYGTQGGAAKDVVHCFNQDGLGAVVSASRSIIYAYLQGGTEADCTREMYKEAVIAATAKMNCEIYEELAADKTGMLY